MFSTPYKYFLAVAQNGGFHKAAAELFVSQPAVSRQIKLLEDNLGYPLFKRTTRTVSLTPEGKRLYAALLECAEILKQTLDKITLENSKQLLSGILRIGTISSWDIDQLRKPYLTGFFESNPAVEMSLSRLEQWELIQQLKKNKLDVLLIPLQELENEPGINYITIGKYPFMLILSRSHPLAQYDDIWDRLDQINLYTHHKERAPVASRLAKRGMHPNIVLTPNVDSKIAAAENGQGCTVVISCSKAVLSPKIRAYPIQDMAAELVIAYRNSEDPVISAFLEYVSALYRDETRQIYSNGQE